MDTHSFLRQWTWRRTVFWTVALAAACVWSGPTILRDIRPGPTNLIDFFQEWASARFFFDGRPVYTPQEEALEPYLGFRRDQVHPFNDEFLGVNAHPPTSVLLALPFGALPYTSACLAWNLGSLAALALSLFLIVRQLRLPFPPLALLPTFTLLLLCMPLRLQIFFGQYNLYLLALLVGAWAAQRSDRPVLAGMLLGTATVLKLFPAFLVFPFLVQRRWRVVSASSATIAAWTALTATVFGPQTYLDYVFNVLPPLKFYHDNAANISLTADWHRVLRVLERLHLGSTAWTGPLALRLATAVSSLVVVATVARAAIRAESREQFDLVFGLAVTATLLLSPISWAHAFLLLLLPCAVVWRALPRAGAWRGAFTLLLVLLYMPHWQLWRALAGPLRLADLELRAEDHVHTLLAATLVGFFAFLAAFSRRSLAESLPAEEPLVLAAAAPSGLLRPAPRRVAGPLPPPRVAPAEAVPTSTVAASLRLAGNPSAPRNRQTGG